MTSRSKREVKRRLDDIEGEDSEPVTLAAIVNDDTEEGDSGEEDSDTTLADVINDSEEADQ